MLFTLMDNSLPCYFIYVEVSCEDMIFVLMLYTAERSIVRIKLLVKLLY